MLEKTVFFDFSRQFSQQCIWHIPSVHILVSAVYFSVFSLRMSWDWIFYCLHWLYTFFWHAQFESIWGEIRNIFCPNNKNKNVSSWWKNWFCDISDLTDLNKFSEFDFKSLWKIRCHIFVTFPFHLTWNEIVSLTYVVSMPWFINFPKVINIFRQIIYW